MERPEEPSGRPGAQSGGGKGVGRAIRRSGGGGLWSHSCRPGSYSNNTQVSLGGEIWNSLFPLFSVSGSSVKMEEITL